MTRNLKLAALAAVLVIVVLVLVVVVIVNVNAVTHSLMLSACCRTWCRAADPFMIRHEHGAPCSTLFLCIQQRAARLSLGYIHPLRETSSRKIQTALSYASFFEHTLKGSRSIKKISIC